MKSKAIRINDIERRNQTRAATDSEHIERLAEALADGEQLPPVTVYTANGTAPYLLADGWHRVAAHEKIGARDINAEIRDGNAIDCLTYALSANTAHGLPRTRADKRRCVELAFETWPSDSDNRIAQRCAVSQDFVSRMRTALTGPGSSPSAAHGKPGRPRSTYIKCKSSPTVHDSNMPSETVLESGGTTIPIEPKKPHHDNVRRLFDRSGGKIPEHIFDAWSVAEHRGAVLRQTLAAIEREARDGLAPKPPGVPDPIWAEVPPAVISELAAIRDQLAGIIPHTVCPVCRAAKRKMDSCQMCNGRGWISKARAKRADAAGRKIAAEAERAEAEQAEPLPF